MSVCCRLDALKPSATEPRQDRVHAVHITGRSQHRLPAAGPTIGSFSAAPSPALRDLGVYIDSKLSMKTNRQISHCFSAVRQLRSIWRQVPAAVPVVGRRIDSQQTRLL